MTAPSAAELLGPYRILAFIYLLGGTAALLFAVVPGTDESLRTYDVLAGLGMVVTASVLVLLGPRSRGGLALGVGIAFGSIICCLGAILVQTPQGQMLIGVGLVMLGAFAATYRPPERLVLHLCLMVGGFALAQAINPRFNTSIDLLVLGGVVVGVSLMVSRQANRLRSQALHDSLTGAFNRRGLDLMAAPVSTAVRRSGGLITVGLLDLDDFKGFNDRHGHLAGDEELTCVARCWAAEMRSGDVLARFGGDEFAVVLPGSTPEQAADLVARVRARCRARWSIGLTTWDAGEDLYAALARADHSLFEAKRSGDG